MKLWGGRFGAEGRDAFFEKFSESFSLDHRLILYDLRVNQVYVRHLKSARVLTPLEARRLDRGIEAIRRRVQNRPNWARGQASEDVHTWVEAQLEKEAGPAARKFRTGRSRNDLVATETRLYVKDSAHDLLSACARFMEALVGQARTNASVIMPGYTHLQPAQPILFSHYLLAYFEMALRDAHRFEQCGERADELPLGCGALAGTSVPINRELLARELGFARPARNSLDSTSDRDFVCELIFACSLAVTHLSRLAEDLLIYSSPALGFVEIADAYSTGSSLMPQKKNADSLELIRGRAARIQGALTSSLAMLKGLPLAYNRDLQEDKHALFESVDTAREALEVAARVMATLTVHPGKMQAAAQTGFLTATDLAEALVQRGIPFAEAHERVGRLVRHCFEEKKTFAELDDREALRFIPEWDAKLASLAASPESSIRRRKVTGGTAPSQVARQIAVAARTVRQLKNKHHTKV
jgi:argininosuccinate lyase